MLKRAAPCCLLHRPNHVCKTSQMFQRASTTAVTQQKQNAYSNHPFRLSQPSMPSSLTPPLSPKKNSAINARSEAIDEKRRHAIPVRSQSLLNAIKDNASEKYMSVKGDKETILPVYFNEDDFDDDLDFDFSSVSKPQEKREVVSSPALSWPPSSYPVRSPNVAAQGMVRTIASQPGVDAALGVNGSNEKAACSPTPGVPRKRTLPWEKDSASQPVHYGPRVTQRSMSTAAVVKEEEAELEVDLDSVPPVGKMDPYSMTQSAVKAAIKGRGKKRNLDEMAAPVMQTVAQKLVQTTNVAKVFLSAEQRGVIDLLKTGKSVFFTGSAGTGKSVLLRTAIQELRLKHKQLEKVAVTASTGLAACNIGGITLHSFAGVGLGRESVAEMVKKVKKNKKNVLKWTKTKVLIIDEISMVDADFYDKLEAVARKLRANEKPWGGIQIVATGDFFQLPPVPDQGKVARFAFEAERWKDLDATIQLTTVFRQKDEDFVEMLNQMRTGMLTEKTIQNFKQLQRPLQHNDGIIPTELFPTRYEVDTANALRMRQLPGEVHTFDAEDSGSILDLGQRAKLLSNCMAPVRLDLKRGAQVMLIKNRDEGLVNGSLGVIIGFMNEKTYTYATEGGEAEFDETVLRDSPWTSDELAAMEQTPAGKRKLLKLKSMEVSAATQRVWPLVRFKSPNGGQDMTQLMSPESWKIEQPNGDVQAARKQVPLILAYAISIHKAQGQTIERVKVDLGKVFEKGQAYVALSRAVSKEGLQVLRFDVKRVMAHPKVAAFYRELVDATDAIDQHKDVPVKMERTVSKTKQEEEDEFMDAMSTQEIFSQIKRDPMKAYKTQPKVKVGRTS